MFITSMDRSSESQHPALGMEGKRVAWLSPPAVPGPCMLGVVSRQASPPWVHIQASGHCDQPTGTGTGRDSWFLSLAKEGMCWMEGKDFVRKVKNWCLDWWNQETAEVPAVGKAEALGQSQGGLFFVITHRFSWSFQLHPLPIRITGLPRVTLVANCEPSFLCMDLLIIQHLLNACCLNVVSPRKRNLRQGFVGSWWMTGPEFREPQ